jgi:NADH-quinone oxidoreductase subunit M
MPDVLTKGSLLETYRWIPSLAATEFGLFLDGLSFPISAISAFITILLVVYSTKYMGDNYGNMGGYFGNLLLLYVGCQGVFLATNLFQFYLFWELTLIPAYFLVLFWSESNELNVDVRNTAIKLFLFTHIASLFLLAGIILIFTTAGTLNMLVLQTLQPSSSILDIIKLAMICMLIGFFVKIGIVPGHFWLPDTYAHAPLPATAMISAIMAKIGAYGIVRLTALTLSDVIFSHSLIIAVIALISMVYGSIMALAQTDVKRFLAYSSISQSGYIVLGVASVGVIGLTGAAFHIVNHAIIKALLFLCAGSYIQQTGSNKLNSFRGLVKKMPVTSGSILIASLSLSGIPPLNGFFSEFLIFAGAFTNLNIIIVAVPAVLSVGLTFSYFLWLIYRIFVSKPQDSVEGIQESPPSLTVPILLLTLLVVLIGIWPNTILIFLSKWSESLTLLGGT